MHVWVVPLDDPDKKRRRELAHLAEGRLLAAYLDLTPAMLEFERASGGKPRLRGEPLQFNLSHSDRLALLAVSSVLPVGVDVQGPHPNAAKPWFAKRDVHRAGVRAFRRPARSRGPAAPVGPQGGGHQGAR